MNTPDSKSKGNFVTAYLRAFAKHKFLIMVPLVVVFLGFAIVGSTLPKVYKAPAIFRKLTPSSSKGEPVRRLTADDLKNELEVMKQIILSRANVVEVIKDVGLDSSYRNLREVDREAHEEKLIKHFRKKLEVQQKAKRVFEVYYRSDDPDIVARVANSVMTRYIEGVVKGERERMAATVVFLEKQVKDYQTRVSASSEALERFKAKHILELPGSDLSESTELRNLRDQLHAAEAGLSNAETAKKEIEKQLLAVDSTAVGETVVETNPLVAQYKAELDRLELELATLQSRFTDLHPDVVKKRSEIKGLKSLIEKAAERVTTKETRQANPLYVSLQQELRSEEVRIASAKRRKEQLLAKKAESEERVRNAPALETEMAKLIEEDGLNRKLQAYYTTELQNARIEQEREIEQKGTRFKVLDYARKSSSDTKSNQLKISLIGLLAGVSLGLGLVVLKDQTDTSFKDVEDAASFLDIPIIGTIPVISTTTERVREKKRQALAWVLVGALAVLLGAVLIVISLTSLPGR